MKLNRVFGVLLVFLFLAVVTFFGDKGILHLMHLKKELSRIKAVNVKVDEENRKLKEEVSRLQHDRRYIEEIARKELGMVKDGEIIYHFDVPSNQKEASR